MDPAHLHVALMYDDDAYVDSAQVTSAPNGRLGVMGRQVAGKEFLDAYLHHGRWKEITAIVRNRGSQQSITDLWRSLHKSVTMNRQLRIAGQAGFHTHYFPNPPSRILHIPSPPDEKFAWVRQHRDPAAFALSGVTHTLCTGRIARSLCNLVEGPFESYDTLFCTSKCAVAMVRAVTDNYCSYMRDRYGGSPSCRVHLAQVPLGVNPEKFKPATPQERAEARKAIDIHDDEFMVLCVGRLSFHAKAHPYPAYEALAQAAQMTGRKIHLVYFGWAANEGIAQCFRDGAAAFATGVRVTFVDGRKDEFRFKVWQAADACVSLSDNFQETFGLVITEAMSSGLPIVASDWDGYRDQVVDGETGMLVPTYMVRDAVADATSRLLFDEIDYDRFLGECNQTVIVDSNAAASAFARLITDEDLCRRMGQAARKRVLERFTWAHVVRSYEDTWDAQEAERRQHAEQIAGKSKAFATPANFPDMDTAFGTFPTALLSDDDQLVAESSAIDRLPQLLAMPLTAYHPERRSSDPQKIRSILEAAQQPKSLAELDDLFQTHQINRPFARATVAWMLKYGLLKRYDSHPA